MQSCKTRAREHIPSTLENNISLPCSLRYLKLIEAAVACMNATEDAVIPVSIYEKNINEITQNKQHKTVIGQ